MARILLADDEAATRDFIKRALEQDSHEIVTATDGTEALGQLTGDAGFDLLITDVHMPAMDGLTLAEKAARLQPGLPILLMSGYTIDRSQLITELSRNDNDPRTPRSKNSCDTRQ